MTNVKITLIMPVWNSFTRIENVQKGGTLATALESLANQTFRNFEVHILDNRSVDGTFEFIQEWCNRDSRFRLTQDSEQRFPEAAIQLLAEGVESEYLAIVNDDDLWEENFLEKMIQKLEGNPTIDLVFPEARSITLNGEKGNTLVNRKFVHDISIEKHLETKDQVFFRYRSVIPTMFGLFRTKSFRNSLPLAAFDELKANVDNRFMLQFFSNGYQAEFYDEVLFYYRSRPRKVTGISLKNQELTNQAIHDLVKRYVQHQLEFYSLAIDLLDTKHYNRIEKITYLASTIFHIYELLKWIKSDYATNKHLKEIINRYLQVFRAMILKHLDEYCIVKVGEFEYKDPNSLVNIQELREKLSSPMINALRQIVNIYETSGANDQSILELTTIRMKVEASVLSYNQINQNQLSLESKNKICVYTCSYNLENFVTFTMGSIQEQEGINLEHLIVEGGSQDNSVSILESYKNAKIISRKDNGFIDGAWKALTSTTADYIAQCCISDGFANNQWLATAINELEENPEISLVWGFPRYLSEDDIPGSISYEFLHWKDIPQEEDMYLYWLSTGFFFPEGNFVCHSKVYRECLPTLQECSDIEPFLEFSKRFHTEGYLSRGIPVVANFGRTHESQLSSRQEASGALQKMRANYDRTIRAENRNVRKIGVKKFRGPDGIAIRELKISKINLGIQMRNFLQSWLRNFYAKLPKSIQIAIRGFLKR